MSTADSVAGVTLEHAAFSELLARHMRIVRKVAASYAANTSDRLDLAQEICLQLWRAWPSYDRERPFSTWMYRIALNVGISFLRRTGGPRQRTRSLEELDFEPIDTSARDPDLEERIALLYRVIGRLDGLDRALLLLYLDELAYRQIADILGITETNVATRLGRLRQRLRQELTR